MEYEFEIQNPFLFPDGGVFLATASIDLDERMTHWRIPKTFEEIFRRITPTLPPESCLDAEVVSARAAELDRALGLEEGTIAWRLAAGYVYDEPRLPLLPSIEIYSNRNNDLPPGTKRDKFSWWYITHKYATCRVEDREVVSICFADDGGITTATKEAHRRRGLASACLRRIAAELVKDGIRPGYGTGYDDVASRRTAESAGFHLVEYMYWIEITAERRWSLPASFNRKLDNSTSA